MHGQTNRRAVGAFDNSKAVGIFSNMAAELLIDERHILDAESFVEIVVWRLPKPVPGSRHAFKYRLAYVSNGECVLRYDNEVGKGDHRHFGQKETAYSFISPETLLSDFWGDVERWRVR